MNAFGNIKLSVRGTNTVSAKVAMLFVILLTVLSFICLPTNGQTVQPANKEILNQTATDSVSMRILFPVGRALVDPNFADNKSKIDDFTQKLEGVTITSAVVKGQASPEGPKDMNVRLSGKRANNLAIWLKSTLNIADSLLVTEAEGVDWGGLEAAVEASTMSERDDVLNIIRNTPEYIFNSKKQLVDGRKKRLMDMNGGRTWNKMDKEIFPSLRSASTVIVYFTPKKQEPGAVEEPAETPAVEQNEEAEKVLMSESSQEETAGTGLLSTKEEEEQTEVVGKPRKAPVFALRSNLLVPFLNVGVELPLGNHLSLGADYYYPWIWPSESNKNCFELAFVSGELRYWFGERTKERRLLGHSIAAYGAWGYYDFEHNWSGRQGEFTSFGADYIYAIPIAKGRLHLEFQLAVGYLHSMTQPYDVYNKGGNLIRRQNTQKKINYFGPTKAAISLVLPI